MSVIRREKPPNEFYRIKGKEYIQLASVEMLLRKRLDILEKSQSLLSKEAFKNLIKDTKFKQTLLLSKRNAINKYYVNRRRYYLNNYKSNEIGDDKNASADICLNKIYNDLKENYNLTKNANNRFVDKISLGLDEDVLPYLRYPKIPNFVVIAHLGKNGNNLCVDQKRIHLYVPNAVKNLNFAATIIPQDGATALFFDNGKTVLIGTTGLDNALFSLQMYRFTLSRVKQPVIYYKEISIMNKETNNVVNLTIETYEICYLKTILDFGWFKGTNTVGNGPIAQDGHMVDLSAILEKYPETNWNPEIFPGLKFHLPNGNNIIPEGKRCTAHIFESKIVIMGLDDPKNIAIAYRFFLELVKPFLSNFSADYEEDRYSYRYNQMLKNLKKDQPNFVESECKSEINSIKIVGDTTKDSAEMLKQSENIFCITESEHIDTNNTIDNNKSNNENESNAKNSPDSHSSPSSSINSLFDFDLREQLPPEMLKKLTSTLKMGSKIKSAYETDTNW